jgi:hypothetical protein
MPNKNLIKTRIEFQLSVVLSDLRTIEEELEKKLSVSSQKPFDYLQLKPSYDRLHVLNKKRKKIQQLLRTGTYGVRKKIRIKFRVCVCTIKG